MVILVSFISFKELVEALHSVRRPRNLARTHRDRRCKGAP